MVSTFSLCFVQNLVFVGVSNQAPPTKVVAECFVFTPLPEVICYIIHPSYFVAQSVQLLCKVHGGLLPSSPSQMNTNVILVHPVVWLSVDSCRDGPCVQRPVLHACISIKAGAACIHFYQRVSIKGFVGFVIVFSPLTFGSSSSCCMQQFSPGCKVE